MIPKKLDRVLRKLVPSTALLSRSAPGAVALTATDLLTRPMLRVFNRRTVPPLRYIVRTGVANSIFFPQDYYLTSSYGTWMYFFATGVAKLDSRIVDIGSGIGKGAVALRDFHYHGIGFTGRYLGFDVDREMVEWCNRNFPAENFRFSWVDAGSTVYNPGARKEPPRLDVPDGTVDLVYSHSLFSHLLEEDLENYVAESYRMLRPGGTMLMTFFCLDDLEALGLLGGRWTFQHTVGAAKVENARYPESAVAYSREWITDVARRVGFSSVDVILPAHQSTLRCTR